MVRLHLNEYNNLHSMREKGGSRVGTLKSLPLISIEIQNNQVLSLFLDRTNFNTFVLLSKVHKVLLNCLLYTYVIVYAH